MVDIAFMISDSEREAQSAAEDEFKGVDVVVQSLLRAAAKHPDCLNEVTKSFYSVSLSNGTGMLSKVIQFLDSHFTLKVLERIRIYEILTHAVLRPIIGKYGLLNEVDLGPGRIKSFVLRVLTDMERMDAVISASSLESLAELIAQLSILAFEELVIDLFLQTQYVGGKPTVDVCAVQAALSLIYGDFASEAVLEKNLHLTLLRLSNMAASVCVNYGLLSSIVKGVHRTGISVSADTTNALIIRSLIDVMPVNTESLEAVIGLLSLIDFDHGDEKLVYVVQEVENLVFSLGQSELPQNEEKFTSAVSVMWKYQVGLFRYSGILKQEEIFAFLLHAHESSRHLWEETWHSDRTPSEAVSFLCRTVSQCGFDSDSLGPVAFDAISVLLGSVGRLSRTTPSYVGEILQTIEKIVLDYSAESGGFRYQKILPEYVLKLVSVMGDLEGSLVTPLMVEFFIKLVCHPDEGFIDRFHMDPGTTTVSHISLLRTAAAQTLTAVCRSPTANKQYLLIELVECLEHMPQVGVSEIASCVALLVKEAGDCVDPLPLVQGVTVLIWLLVNNSSEACYIFSISHLLHPHLANLQYDPSLFRTVGDEFSYVMSVIEDDGERRDFSVAAREMTLSVMASPRTTASVRAQLIQIWGTCVREGPISEEIDKIFALHGSEIACSPETIAATSIELGKCIARVALQGEYVAQLMKILGATNEALEKSIDGGTSSIANSLRTKRNSQSVIRNLFSSEYVETGIKNRLKVKEIILRSLGQVVACSEGMDEGGVVANTLIGELVRDKSLLLDWVKSMAPSGDSLDEKKSAPLALDTTLAAIEATGLLAQSFARNIVSLEVSRVSAFHASALCCCLNLLIAASQHVDCGGRPLIGPLLHTLADIVSIDNFPISAEDFGTLLETSLHAIVQTLPDTLGSLETEIGLLTDRCDQTGKLVRSLFLHAASWRGLSRLVRAVNSLGGNGPLPVIRWVCVRIVSILVQGVDLLIASTDSQPEEHSSLDELLEVFTSLVPRLSDSTAPVRLEALVAATSLLQRWEPTSAEAGRVKQSIGENWPTFDSSESCPPLFELVLKHVPDCSVPAFLLSLIGSVHDCDSASSVVDSIHQLLIKKSVHAFSAPAAPADSVVEAILSCAKNFPSPPAPPANWPEVQKQLVDSLKYIAAVRFPIAIQKVLSYPLDPTGDKALAIQSFVKEKQTLSFLTKELIDRLHNKENDRLDRTNAVTDSNQNSVTVTALGLVLDCYTDSGVASIAKKHFGELFAGLLILLADERERESELVKSVIHKLFRAAQLSQIGDSVTTDSAVDLLRSSVEGDEAGTKLFERILDSMADAVNGRQMGTGCVAVASALAGRSQRIDLIFLSQFEQICQYSAGSHSVDYWRIVHAISGLRKIICRWKKDRKNSIEDVDAQCLLLLNLLAGSGSFLTHVEERVAVEALRTVQLILTLMEKDPENDDDFSSSTALPSIASLLVHKLMPLLKRIVDHRHVEVRIEAFLLLTRVCESLTAMGFFSNDYDNQEHHADLPAFYNSVGDLWVPCIVRTQDPENPLIRIAAQNAFVAILNSAIADRPIIIDPTTDPINKYSELLHIAISEIGECSHVHLNACCYYFIGLSSVTPQVIQAAVSLVPVIIKMIPDTSTEATASVIDILNKLLTLEHLYSTPVLGEILIEAKRIDPGNTLVRSA